MKRSLLLILSSAALALSGCGKSTADEALSQMEKFKDQMCKCNDKACVDQVDKDMREAKKDFKKNNEKPSEDEIKKMKEKGEPIMKEMMDCRMKAMGAGGDKKDDKKADGGDKKEEKKEGGW